MKKHLTNILVTIPILTITLVNFTFNEICDNQIKGNSTYTSIETKIQKSENIEFVIRNDIKDIDGNLVPNLWVLKINK